MNCFHALDHPVSPKGNSRTAESELEKRKRFDSSEVQPSCVGPAAGDLPGKWETLPLVYKMY